MSIETIKSVFIKQKKAYSPSNPPTYQVRMDRLSRIESMCKNHISEITEALQADFGTRDPDLNCLDVWGPCGNTKDVKKHLKKWMKKEKTSSGLWAFTGQRSYIVHEPLGVVGIMSPFNSPITLALDPAIDAIAAGNRVMIKFSENTAHTATLMQSLVSKYFHEEELAVAVGDAEVSRVFASLPWDKFLFTGGSEIGKRILEACAENLTPVILELGGKSPCVILDDANIPEVAKKIQRVRMMNSGQVCISGDYVMIPERHLEMFIDSVLENAKSDYPSIIKNKNFTSIIDNRSYERITSYVEEAKHAECRIITSNPMSENVPDEATRKIPLTLVINPKDHLKVSMHEAFGPILSIYTYKKIKDAIDYINTKPKPLALYIFGKNRNEIEKVINSTSSGGVTVNDLLMHAGSKAMGFGGVGYSGMGRYKGGKIGFEAFSNPKSVVEQGILRKFTHAFIPPLKSDNERNMLKRQMGIK